jgi:hypothetical protein
MEKFRLEYSEKQGCFHFEDIEKPNRNTNHYFTLCDELDELSCHRFFYKMVKKYPKLKTGNGFDYPKFRVIAKEFKDFLK